MPSFDQDYRKVNAQKRANKCAHSVIPNHWGYLCCTFFSPCEILNQDGVITELEMERDRLSRELQSAEARLKVGEKSGKDLTEEYAALKKSYLSLTEAHDKELAHSEELSAELLALAQAQDALRRQLEEQQQSVRTAAHSLHGELDRVRALMSRMSRNRVKVRQCVN